MKFTTERLIIRPYKKADYKRVFEICNDYEFVKTTLGIPYPYTIDMAKTYIERTNQALKEKRYYELAICFKDDEKTVIGCVQLVAITERAKRAEIGFWVDRKLWGKGIATEAAKAMLDFAFEELKLNSVYARHFDINPASGKVMQKCGMKYAGVLRQNEFRFDKYYDVVYYDVLAEEWENISKMYAITERLRR